MDNELNKLYQSLNKPEPSEQLNQAIVEAAKAQLSEQSVINKKQTRAWWLAGRFQGAIAASVLLVCLVYLLPQGYVEPPNSESDSLALNDIESPIPSTQNIEVQPQSQYAVAKRTEQAPASEAQSVAPTNSSMSLNEGGSASGLAARFNKSEEVMADTDIQTSDSLLTNNNEGRKRASALSKTLTYAELKDKADKLVDKLIAIQETTKLSHQQIMNRASILASSRSNNENSLLIKQYASLHQALLKNLQTTLQYFPEKRDISSYQAVLSEEDEKALLGSAIN